MSRQAKQRSHAVAPVSAVCGAFAAQPSAYPPEASKPHVAPPCGSVAGVANVEQTAEGIIRSATDMRKRQKWKNRAILDAAARKRRESRIKGWRRNRRFSCSQQPAVRTVSRGCAGAAIGACLEEIMRGWHQKSRKRRRFKGFRRATPQIGGL